MAYDVDTPATGRTPMAAAHVGTVRRAADGSAESTLRRIDVPRMPVSGFERYPTRLNREALCRAAYPWMYRSRKMEERLVELYRKGYVKGTVTIGNGNEAVAVGMTLPMRPSLDVVSLLHRDLAGHMILGSDPHEIFCQFMANAASPTHACEGNVHFGNAANRRLPMMSHLGKMLSLVVGGTWAARRNGESAFGFAIIGDGGTSTGEFHEALNLASVHRVPVLFVIENNQYAFSTPTRAQYRCEHLSDRAAGYGISGRTIDGTDVFGVYNAVCDAMDTMGEENLPAILECMTVRLHGHAVYDKAEYISDEDMRAWRQRDPVAQTRQKLVDVCGLSEKDIVKIESAIEEEVHESLASAMPVARPTAPKHHWNVFATSTPPAVEPLAALKVKNGDAVRMALEYILSHCEEAFLAGMDIGVYGSAFKTCKGLIERFGPHRVIDMPICESGIMGFSLGSSQVGAKPIVEFQFADFSTEAVSQLGLNAGTWHFRTGSSAPLLIRLPCGGGLTMGAFHSGEYEGLWSRFPGLKLLYPVTPQETFEALLAGFYDPNPCLVFEHKLLYWSRLGEIDFDGELESVWRARRYTEGTELTVVAFGAMVHEAIAAAGRFGDTGRGLESVCLAADGPRADSRLGESHRPAAGGARRRRERPAWAITSSLGRCGTAAAHGSVAHDSWRPPTFPSPFAPELELHYRPNADRIAATIEQMLGET